MINNLAGKVTGIFEMITILRDFKSFTSRQLRLATTDDVQESRREWMLKMMYETGLGNSDNRGFQLWQQHNQPIELSNNEMFDIAAQRIIRESLGS